jgi:hypothetical protein
MNAASELLNALKAATTAAAARHALHRLEDELTPLELSDLLPALKDLSGLAKVAGESSIVFRELQRADPQPYLRRAIAADVALFSTTEPPPAEKSLIIALCGRSNRLMLPLSLFLQFVPASQFDVVILADRKKDDYFAGIEGYATDMWSLVQRTLADAGARQYRRLYCYGTSGGGFPALRFGLLAGAYRSISIGGTFSWQIHRLERGKSMLAFDPLCHCNAKPQRHVVCVHASEARHDNKAATRLQRVMKISRIPVVGTAVHNIIYMIYRAGGLPMFNAQLFDFDPRLARVSRPKSSGSPGSRGPGAVGVQS